MMSMDDLSLNHAESPLRLHSALDRLVFGDCAEDAEMPSITADCELQWSFTAPAMPLCNAQGGDGEAGNDSSAEEPKAVTKKHVPIVTRLALVTRGSDHKKRRVNRRDKKATYLVRKEEKQRLLQEMKLLKEQLKELVEHGSRLTGMLAASKRKNTLLRESIHRHQLSVATSQCVVSRLLSGEQANPLSTTHIRLGTDWDDRQHCLLEMKDRSIRHACEYIKARGRFLDPLKRHVSEERFETPGGDFCCARYDTHQFANVQSVKQVYDVLVSYMYNIEISVSEQLGNITTRDDFDFVENSLANIRFLTMEFGVPMEKHGVLFMEYFESHELFGGEPCGVVVIDRVEDDALYPYTPQERVRKDVSISIVLRPHWRARPDAHGEKELVVSMSFGKFIKLHHSECKLATPAAMEKVRENIMGWGGVIISTMRDILDWKSL